jgi:hypothetical protein
MKNIVILILLLFMFFLLLISSNEKLFNKIYPLFTKDEYEKRIRKIICKNISSETINEIRKVKNEQQIKIKNLQRIEKLKNLNIK